MKNLSGTVVALFFLMGFSSGCALNETTLSGTELPLEGTTVLGGGENSGAGFAKSGGTTTVIDMRGVAPAMAPSGGGGSIKKNIKKGRIITAPSAAPSVPAQ